MNTLQKGQLDYTLRMFIGGRLVNSGTEVQIWFSWPGSIEGHLIGAWNIEQKEWSSQGYCEAL